MKTFCVSALLLLFVFSAKAQNEQVIVISERANLRGTPSATGVVLTEVVKDSQFELIKIKGAWYLVQTPKYVGWLHGNTLLPNLSRTAVNTTPRNKSNEDDLERYVAQFKVNTPPTSQSNPANFDDYLKTQQIKTPREAENLPDLSNLEVPPETTTRYSSGEDLIAPQSSGRSSLTVNNGTDFDAVAKLVDNYTGKTHRLVYVRSNSAAIVKGIAQGSYVLKFSLGLDYVSSKNKFLNAQSYSKFDDILDFKEQQLSDRVVWSNFTVGLKKTTSGNAQTSTINAADFEDK